jgi:uncharacterized membrane protein
VLDLPRSLPKRIALLLLALFFVGAGVSHFTNPGFFTAIVPPALPAPLALVYLSGVFEILGGLGVLWPATRTAAGVGLVALLLAAITGLGASLGRRSPGACRVDRTRLIAPRFAP